MGDPYQRQPMNIFTTSGSWWSKKKQFIARNAAVGDCRTHAFLVVIGLCCVDHAVTHLHGIAYASLALRRIHLIYTIADLRHHYSISKFYCIHIQVFHNLSQNYNSFRKFLFHKIP